MDAGVDSSAHMTMGPRDLMIDRRWQAVHPSWRVPVGVGGGGGGGGRASRGCGRASTHLNIEGWVGEAQGCPPAASAPQLEGPRGAEPPARPPPPCNAYACTATEGSGDKESGWGERGAGRKRGTHTHRQWPNGLVAVASTVVVMSAFYTQDLQALLRKQVCRGGGEEDPCTARTG